MPSTIPRGLAHTPAWKRIGLKLKLPQVQTYSLNTVIVEDSNLKRKAASLDYSDKKDIKKTKITTEITSQKVHEGTPTNSSTKKSVTFTSETKVEDGDSIKKLFKTWVAQQKSHHSPNSLFKSHEALEINTDSSCLDEEKDFKKSNKKRKPKSTKVSKQMKSQVTNELTNDIPPFLSYLREYHESKETWKFKKNHQTHLLQRIFDIDRVPSNYAHLIYTYVRGLRGQVRTRLRDAAIAVKVDDREKGMSGFPSELLNPEQRQKEYEAAIEDYISNTTLSHIQQLGHEDSFLSKFEDELMKSRIIRRIRAEMILIELASSTDGNEIVSIEVSKEQDSGKIRPESNPAQKKVRRRKKRTVIVEESSADDSDSDSESDDNVLVDTDADENKPNVLSSSCSVSSSDSD
ncbi:putative proteasome subunit alpha type 6 [Erysiphe neolycopersici]|uniref:Putative proteasome subunit alpha type 6 n=1 Tax=Erysiphe neolycopersici TaxID=212602 RepID=A0A420HHA9_9PEZI|nr:putative proteasome subunit alpha type 6 [Erysiphe neolycopersici]